jgi:hypothetical protein
MKEAKYQAGTILMPAFIAVPVQDSQAFLNFI